MHQILNYVANSATRLIKISGPRGIGKTRLVKEVGHLINERRLAIDGVYYIDFKKVINQAQINNAFSEAGIDYLLQLKQGENIVSDQDES